MHPFEIQPQKVNNVRRSQRVLLSAPVVVSGKVNEERQFYQETRTVVVNAHGALVLLRPRVALGQLLTLRNIKTQEERGCRVVNLVLRETTQTEAGVEFLQPSPGFWHIAFPPTDWIPRSDEGKRCTPRFAR